MLKIMKLTRNTMGEFIKRKNRFQRSSKNEGYAASRQVEGRVFLVKSKKQTGNRFCSCKSNDEGARVSDDRENGHRYIVHRHTVSDDIWGRSLECARMGLVFGHFLL